MVQIPLRLMQAVLIVWIVAVGVAYLTGGTPVYALIGIIVTTTSILVRRFVQNAS